MSASIIYLAAAYAVFWGVSFTLLLTIWARQRRLEREVAALEARLERMAPEERDRDRRTHV